ncbi:MAG: hypothetical protein J6A94_09025, partial [Lachnospiraceae bacterium]|nr:hypothetical protein [Lachnospiraceae bacterium]
MKRRVGKILSCLLVLLMVAGNVQIVKAATDTSTEGSTKKTYYNEDFEYPDSVGTAYFPADWTKKGDNPATGSGGDNLAVLKEADNYYYSVDASAGSPKYMGKIWGSETPANAILEFDFRLQKTDDTNSKEISLFSYESRVDGGTLAIRGKITDKGELVFHNGSTGKTLGSIKDAGWVHFRYDIDNTNKTYDLAVTSVSSGDVVAETAEPYSFHKAEAAQAGAISFTVEDAVWFDLDNIELYELVEEPVAEPDDKPIEEPKEEETEDEKIEEESPTGEYKVYYEQVFDYPEHEGGAYIPSKWSTKGEVGDGTGNLTIAKEEDNYYYSIDASMGAPKYMGYVIPDISKEAKLEYDLRLNTASPSEDIGLYSYSSSINGGKLAVRGAIDKKGDVYFYNGSSKVSTAIANIAGSKWVTFIYDINNKEYNYQVTVADKATGEELGKTEVLNYYHGAEAQVGAFSFQISETGAKLDMDNVKVHGYEEPFTYEPEIDAWTKDGKVSVTESTDGATYTIENDYCMVVIDKVTGDVLQFYTSDGKELCGANGKGYYLLNYKDSAHVGTAKQETSFKGGVGTIVKQSDSICEISVKAVEMEGQGGQKLPIDVDLRYVLTNDTPGLYMYAIFNRSEGTDPERTFALEQSRFAFKYDFKSLPYSCVEDGIMKEIAGPGDFADLEQLFDSTYILNDGTIYTKYKNCTYQYDHYLCGAYSEEAGLSLITPSRDWAGGGYLKQDIDVHGGKSNTFYVHWHLSTAHMGTQVAWVEEGFKKVYGPVLWYPNTSVDSKEEAWEDAWAQTQKEMEKWPYTWVDSDAYVADSRASLKGTFSVKNGEINKEIKNDHTECDSIGWAVLSDMRSVSWQKDNIYYEFYAPIQQDGTFEIDNIIPGTYRLNINVNGVIGEYEQENIVIGDSASIDLGNIVWDDSVYGETLWTIGIPDRTSEEYYYGTPYRYWGAHLLFNTLFPNGVDYKVGESDYTKDWYFMHPASQTIGQKEHYDGAFYYDETIGEVRYDASKATPLVENDPRWRGNELAEYKIRFDSETTYEEGTGTLLLAIAGGRSATLKVSLNGQEISDVMKLDVSGSVGRCCGNDVYDLRKVEFDASMLKEGENVIVLTHDKPAYQEDNVTSYGGDDYKIYAGLMYDAIRLDLDATPTSPEPGTSPEPSATPEPSVTPAPSVSPAPSVNPAPSVSPESVESTESDEDVESGEESVSGTSSGVSTKPAITTSLVAGSTSKLGSTPKPGTGLETPVKPDVVRAFVVKTKADWVKIKESISSAESGDSITITMKDETVVPADVLTGMKEKDINIVLDMAQGIRWTINGRNITAEEPVDLNLKVTVGMDNIPENVMSTIVGKMPHSQIHLAYDGEFGLTAELSVYLTEEYTDLNAKLFYYNETTGKLELQQTSVIDEAGMAK